MHEPSLRAFPTTQPESYLFQALSMVIVFLVGSLQSHPPASDTVFVKFKSVAITNSAHYIEQFLYKSNPLRTCLNKPFVLNKLGETNFP
jgi:hypothetical protein